MRKTWGQIKSSLGNIADLCGSAEELRNLANEAIEALWAEGDWIGKLARYKIRVSGDCHGNRCITWPRQIETIEAVSMCNTPIGVRNIAFEFIENAVGQIDKSCVALLGDRQEVVSFEDVNAGSKTLKVYATVDENANCKVLLLGYDDNNQWIRTQVSGTWFDGEFVDVVNGSPATTNNYFSSLVGVQIGQLVGTTWTVAEHNGPIHLYEVDTLDGDSERWLSTYEYDETIPVYRRSILSGLGNGDQCRCVTVLAKLRFQPVVRDTDYVQISQVGALKEMILSILRRNNDKVQDAEAYRARAIRLLNNELRSYQGNGPRKAARFMEHGTWAAARNLQ